MIWWWLEEGGGGGGWLVDGVGRVGVKGGRGEEDGWEASPTNVPPPPAAVDGRLLTLFGPGVGRGESRPRADGGRAVYRLALTSTTAPPGVLGGREVALYAQPLLTRGRSMAAWSGPPVRASHLHRTALAKETH